MDSWWMFDEFCDTHVCLKVCSVNSKGIDRVTLNLRTRLIQNFHKAFSKKDECEVKSICWIVWTLRLSELRSPSFWFNLVRRLKVFSGVWGAIGVWIMLIDGDFILLRGFQVLSTPHRSSSPRLYPSCLSWRWVESFPINIQPWYQLLVPVE